jgi:CheY-like chemotaxis protein
MSSAIVDTAWPQLPDEVPGLGRPVVLVDDDDDFRVMFGEALRLDGTRVIEAAGGTVAIAVLDRLARSREQDPTLLVLDLMMPVMSGIEVLQRLRRSPRWAQLPVLIMTAVNDPMLPVMLNAPVVFKPDMDVLVNAVRQNVIRSEMANNRQA